MRKKSFLFAAASLMAISMTACGSSDSGETTSSAVQQTTGADASSAGADTDADTESENNQPDYGYDDDNDDEDDSDIYIEKARAVFEKVDQLFTALKEGDIDTVVALGDPDDDVVWSLSEVSDSEVAKKILQTVYSNLCWKVTDEDIEYLARDLEDMDEYDMDDYYELDLYMDELAYPWMLNFDDNALLYFEEGDVIAENFVPESQEQAFEILQAGLDNTPIQKMTGITISPFDEDGNFYFLYEDDYLFEDAKLDELGYYSDDDMAQYYVVNLLELVTDYEMGDTEAKYEENDELYVQAAQLAADKDFEELTDYLRDYSDKDYREAYGSYEDLNDTQREFVDSCVSEARVIWSDYSCVYGSGDEYRVGSIAVYFPHYEYRPDDDIQIFLNENDVMENGGIFYFSSSNVDSLCSYLLYRYYSCIRYALQYVE